MTELHLVATPIDDLSPSPRNAKTHALAVLDRSYEEFGYMEPIRVDERTGLLNSGHGRVEQLIARRDSGAEPPEGITIDGEGRWLVPVVRGWSSRDDDHAAAAALVTNQSPAAGGWDDAALLDDLRSLDALGMLESTGFTDEDVDELTARIEELAIEADGHGSPRRREADDAPMEPPTEPVSVRGDVWLVGPHRIMCGDSTVPSEVEKLVGGGVIDLVLTDPPYCSGGFQESGRRAGSVGRKSPHKAIANDRLSTRGYMSLMRNALAAAPAEACYVFTDWRMWVNLFDVVESAGFGVRSMIVWDKGSPGMGRGWRSQHELVMFGSKSVGTFNNREAVGNVVRVDRTRNLLHTTEKPVALIDLLLGVSRASRTIYDPFAGSGTTLVSCHRNGRAGFAMELDPGYCDVAVTRLALVTEETPTHAETGRPFPLAAPDD